MDDKCKKKKTEWFKLESGSGSESSWIFGGIFASGFFWTFWSRNPDPSFRKFLVNFTSAELFCPPKTLTSFIYGLLQFMDFRLFWWIPFSGTSQINMCCNQIFHLIFTLHQNKFRIFKFLFNYMLLAL